MSQFGLTRNGAVSRVDLDPSPISPRLSETDEDISAQTATAAQLPLVDLLSHRVRPKLKGTWEGSLLWPNEVNQVRAALQALKPSKIPKFLCLTRTFVGLFLYSEKAGVATLRMRSGSILSCLDSRCFKMICTISGVVSISSLCAHILSRYPRWTTDCVHLKRCDMVRFKGA